MEKTNKTKRVETTFRVPPDLLEELKSTGAKSGRSTNEEIIYRCRAYPQSVAIEEIVKQNAELKRMLQLLIDRQG